MENKKLILDVGSFSEVSTQKPGQENEDKLSIYKDQNLDDILFLIADGMGGHKFPHVASQRGVEETAKELEDLTLAPIKEGIADELVFDWIYKAVSKANESIYYYPLENLGFEVTPSTKQKYVQIDRSPGTTLLVSMILNGKLYYYSIGDTPFYVFYENGDFRKLTKDDNYVRYLIEDGKITEKEALTHPKRSKLTNYLGLRSTIDREKYDLATGVIDLEGVVGILGASDGLTDLVTQDEMKSILQENIDNDAQTTVDSLYDGVQLPIELNTLWGNYLDKNPEILEKYAKENEIDETDVARVVFITEKIRESQDDVSIFYIKPKFEFIEVPEDIIEPEEVIPEPEVVSEPPVVEVTEPIKSKYSFSSVVKSIYDERLKLKEEKEDYESKFSQIKKVVSDWNESFKQYKGIKDVFVNLESNLEMLQEFKWSVGGRKTLDFILHEKAIAGEEGLEKEEVIEGIKDLFNQDEYVFTHEKELLLKFANTLRSDNNTDSEESSGHEQYIADLEQNIKSKSSKDLAKGFKQKGQEINNKIKFEEKGWRKYIRRFIHGDRLAESNIVIDCMDCHEKGEPVKRDIFDKVNDLAEKYVNKKTVTWGVIGASLVAAGMFWMYKLGYKDAVDDAQVYKEKAPIEQPYQKSEKITYSKGNQKPVEKFDVKKHVEPITATPPERKTVKQEKEQKYNISHIVGNVNEAHDYKEIRDVKTGGPGNYLESEQSLDAVEYYQDNSLACSLNKDFQDIIVDGKSLLGNKVFLWYIDVESGQSIFQEPGKKVAFKEKDGSNRDMTGRELQVLAVYDIYNPESNTLKMKQFASIVENKD